MSVAVVEVVEVVEVVAVVEVVGGGGSGPLGTVRFGLESCSWRELAPPHPLAAARIVAARIDTEARRRMDSGL